MSELYSPLQKPTRPQAFSKMDGKHYTYHNALKNEYPHLQYQLESNDCLYESGKSLLYAPQFGNSAALRPAATADEYNNYVQNGAHPS